MSGYTYFCFLERIWQMWIWWIWWVWWIWWIWCHGSCSEGKVEENGIFFASARQRGSNNTLKSQFYQTFSIALPLHGENSLPFPTFYPEVSFLLFQRPRKIPQPGVFTGIPSKFSLWSLSRFPLQVLSFSAASKQGCPLSMKINLGILLPGGAIQGFCCFSGTGKAWKEAAVFSGSLNSVSSKRRIDKLADKLSCKHC